MSSLIPAKAATCATCPSARNRPAMPRWSNTSMVRACRPPERDPATSWLARRSTIIGFTPASASSPASIIPVGPAPAITTACSLIATFPSRPVLTSVADCSARPGACGKPPSGRYPESGRALHRLDRRHATEQPSPPELAVHQPDPRHDETRPEDDPGVDRLLEDQETEGDPDGRGDVGDERRPCGAPVREQPEDQQIGKTRSEDAEPEDREDRLTVGCRGPWMVEQQRQDR